MIITGNEPVSMGFTNDPEALKNLGLTIRQAFAMAAMQGLCAIQDKGTFRCLEDATNNLARVSVLHADALIAALNRSEVADGI